jgi:dienelactone hydrolase
MKNVGSSFFLSLILAFISIPLQTHASSDLESLTSQLIPRQLFSPQQSIRDYRESDAEKLKRLIAKQKGWECIQILYQSERKENDLGINGIFTNADELPSHLYYITPQKKIIQIDSPQTFYGHFENPVTQTLFLWSSFISQNDPNRQYYVFDADTLKSTALNHPKNFSRIVFDANLTPISGMEEHSNGKRIHIQKDDGVWVIASDKEDPQEAVLTNIRPNPFTREVVIVEGVKGSNGSFSNRLLTYHPKNGLKMLHEEVDIMQELIIASIDIVPGVPVCAYSYVNRGKIKWHMADPIFQYVFTDFQDKLRSILGHDDFIINDLGQQDTTHWVAEVSFSQEPNRFATYSFSERTISWAPDNPKNKALRDKKSHFVPYTYEEISAYDQLAIPTFIAQPSKGHRPFPAVVMIHGGPHGRYLPHFSPLVQAFVNRGMLVLIPNFRGSTISANLMAQSQGQWGKGMQKDVHSVIEWSIAQGLVDKSKVAFWGGSYGGYSTLLEAVSPYRSDSFPGICCAVAQCAPTDLEKMLTGFHLEFGPEVDETTMLFASETGGRLGNIPDTVKESLKSVSPLYQVSQKAAPLLMIHGEKDRRVSPVHAYKMSKALKKNHIPHTFITFSEDSHETDDPGIQLAHAALTETFLAQHLGVKSEPFGEDLSYASFTVHEGEELIQGLGKAFDKLCCSLYSRKGIKFRSFPLEDQWLSALIAHELNNARTQHLKIVPVSQNEDRPASLTVFVCQFLLSIFEAHKGILLNF